MARSEEEKEHERYRSLKFTIHFCEHAYEADGFWSLLRCFRGVSHQSYPAIVKPMDAFVLITDAAGVSPRSITATLVDSESMNHVHENPLLWRHTEQLNVQRYRWASTALFHVPALPLRRAGRYDLHLEVDGHLLELVSLDAIVWRGT